MSCPSFRWRYRSRSSRRFIRHGAPQGSIRWKRCVMNDGSPLRLDRVTRIYKQAGRELIVFRDVSLALAPGEIVALVGPSGAGKSSLLHIAGLLEAPSSGEVYVGGEAASTLPERSRTEIRRRALGFVYQFHHLLPEFTALENVAMPRRIAGEASDAAAAEAKRLL